MTFPIIDISTKNWDADNTDIIYFDKYIYTSSDKIFNELFKGKLFCDCNGFVYKAIRKSEMTENWRNWLKFVPNVWKTEIVFQQTFKKLTIEELQNFILTKISELKQDNSTQEWIEKVKKAKTHSDLISV